ncbi:hypothetical protein F183_A44730 [Bryobacterales bacterium F-183]|nr:hypothetical protein F183_A44730 [Bryobacterales bacterium F-183]
MKLRIGIGVAAAGSLIGAASLLLSQTAPEPVTRPASWKMQYFYDEDKSELTITDLEFQSVTSGAACGVITYERKRPQGVVLLTRDGGVTWKQVQAPDVPIDIQFVDDSQVFLLTDKGIYKSEERGLEWKKLKGMAGLNAIHFLDSKRGFVAGVRKQLLATEDGGKTWTPVAEAAKPSAKPEFTSYNWIAFRKDGRGIVLGGSTPPRPRDLPVPAWADPEAAMKQREWPKLSIALETTDGGKNWKSDTAPVFGRMAKLRFGPAESPLAMSLLRYDHAFDYSAEVHLVHWVSGKSAPIFARKDSFVTDVGFTGAKSGFLAAIERPGTMAQSPLPGKLRIHGSADLSLWTEMPVDYRAVGTFATMSVVDAGHAWVALDSGMILHLTR